MVGHAEHHNPDCVVTLLLYENKYMYALTSTFGLIWFPLFQLNNKLIYGLRITQTKVKTLELKSGSNRTKTIDLVWFCGSFSSMHSPRRGFPANLIVLSSLYAGYKFPRFCEFVFVIRLVKGLVGVCIYMG